MVNLTSLSVVSVKFKLIVAMVDPSDSVVARVVVSSVVGIDVVLVVVSSTVTVLGSV